MNILVTGAAGFIGFHLIKLLVKKKYNVLGIDSLNNYYDVNLKKKRLKILKVKENKNFKFIKNNLMTERSLIKIINNNNITIVIHLAAQPGVRYSLKKPAEYVKNNILASTNLFEACRKSKKIRHILLASSSSVYAASAEIPYKETDSADFPLQFYAVTKRSTELMAHSYSHLYNIPFTIMRLFTVYGPFGRPDMALYKFTKNILNNKKIEIYNNGNHTRDFTYITDTISGIEKLIKKIPKKVENFGVNKNFYYYSKAKIRVINLGSGNPRKLKDYITNIEKFTKKKSKKKYLPFQKGDAIKTAAKINKLIKLTGYKPKVKIEEGIKNFVTWFKKFK